MKIAIAAATLVTLALAACNKGNTTAPPPASPTPTVELTENVIMSDHTPAPRQTWKVKDNGKRCIAAPCFSWTATSSSGVDREFSDMDVSALELSADEEKVAKESILAGKAKVGGYFQPHEKAGPAGDGLTFFVTSLEE